MRSLILLSVVLALFGVAAPAAAAAPVTGIGLWSWQNPLPEGNPLASVSCPAAGQCVAVGEVGSIVTTGDSGATWARRSAGTTRDLTRITCPTTFLCVGVGAAGRVVRTADGGSTWTRPSPKTGRNLAGISCSDPMICYVVGAGGTVARSGDGGVSWTKLATGITIDLGVVSCPTASTCYAAGRPAVYNGPAIYVSTDSGATWAGHPGVSDGRTIACTSATTCIVGGGGTTRTVDGGQTWTTISQFGARAVSCPDSSHCYAVTGYDTMLRFSTDGGASWYTRPMPQGFINDINCWSTTACITVGEGGEIVVTGDSGDHWGLVSKGSVNVTVGPARMFSLSCPTSLDCYGVINNLTGDLVYATHDRGLHWDPGGYLPGVSRASGISCTAARYCVVAGSFNAYTSADGGLSWTQQSRFADSTDVHAISCPSSTMCIAAGSNGTSPPQGLLARSSDGGQTWVAQFVGNHVLYSVSCGSPSTCVAAGNGSVYSTNDAGQTWTDRTFVPSVYSTGVSCAGPSFCKMTSYFDSKIYGSSDGGATWTVEQPGMASAPFTVACLNSSVCLAAGNGGAMSATNDGGLTWKRQSPPTHNDLAALACSSYCWVSGAYGSILRTPLKH